MKNALVTREKELFTRNHDRLQICSRHLLNRYFQKLVLDNPTLRNVYTHLSGFDLADSRLVSRHWNNFISGAATSLPLIFLHKVSAKQVKVWISGGGHKTVIQVEITECKRPFTLSRGDATDFAPSYERRTLSFTVQSQQELSKKFLSLIRLSHIETLSFANLFPSPIFALRLGNVAPTVSVGQMTFDNVSFTSLLSCEFSRFFFDFDKIESIDLENSTAPMWHIDNAFLLGLASCGVRRLLLPKHHPIEAENYSMDVEGISNFLTHAPAGHIELAARHLTGTLWTTRRQIQEIRTALLRPGCAVDLFIFEHNVNMDDASLLKDLDGTTSGPPPSKRPRTVVRNELLVDVEPHVIRVANQSVLRNN